jgi:2-polyprenyl-3-methyl-5-hydroxy-6-metoxy-1,4-benzoquinol methylase
MNDMPCFVCGGKGEKVFYTVEEKKFLSCMGCGLISLEQIPGAQEFYAHYNERYYTKDYAGRGERSFPDFSYRFRFLDRFISPPGNVLEVGAAGGEFLELLKKRGWEVSGVEISEPAVRAAHRNYGLTLEQGVLEDVAYPSNTFDVVLLYHVLEHVRYPLETLAEIRRILKPGGSIIVELPNPTGFDARVSATLLESVLDYPNHLHLFPKNTARRILVQSGFGETACEASFSFALASLLPHFKRGYARAKRTEEGETIIPLPEKYMTLPPQRARSLLGRLFPGMKFTIRAIKI